MAYAVEIVDVVARHLAVARGRAEMGKVPEQFMPLLDKVWAVVRTLGVDPVGPNVAVYRFRDGGLDLEIGVQVAAAFEAVGDVEPSLTPAGRCARTLLTGSYAGIRAATDAVIAFVRDNNIPITGLSWEVYGDWTEDESKLETWIHFQLA
ncbi:MAG: transcription activator effector binding protein [Caulobacter sp.]|nr:transcription activator effector binding protein [Caulobacter sp.]